MTSVRSLVLLTVSRDVTKQGQFKDFTKKKKGIAVKTTRTSFIVWCSASKTGVLTKLFTVLIRVLMIY